MSFGLEKLGGKCLLAAEYDPLAKGVQFAQEAYKVLHPTTPVVGDVRELDANDVPDSDILTFTTPCQTFSSAGKFLGFDDTRGTLVFEALRIAKARQPKVLIMENVKGLLSHDKGRSFEMILRAMNDVGYFVDFNILQSHNYEVPQKRERVYIVGIRKDLVNESPLIVLDIKGVVHRIRKKLMKERDTECVAPIQTFNLSWPEPSSRTMSVKDIIIPTSEMKESSFVNESNLFSYIKENNIPKELVQQEFLNPKSPLRAIFREEILSVVSQTRKKRFPFIEARFVENGNVSAFDTGTSLSGISEVSVVFEENPSHTVTCAHIPKYYGPSTDYRIRKLTPLECFRLQSFSDNAYYLLKEASFSDARLYKFIGNAVSVNVVEALGHSILKQLNIANTPVTLYN